MIRTTYRNSKVNNIVNNDLLLRTPDVVEKIKNNLLRLVPDESVIPLR